MFKILLFIFNIILACSANTLAPTGNVTCKRVAELQITCDFPEPTYQEDVIVYHIDLKHSECPAPCTKDYELPLPYMFEKAPGLYPSVRFLDRKFDVVITPLMDDGFHEELAGHYDGITIDLKNIIPRVKYKIKLNDAVESLTPITFTNALGPKAASDFESQD